MWRPTSTWATAGRRCLAFSPCWCRSSATRARSTHSPQSTRSHTRPWKDTSRAEQDSGADRRLGQPAVPGHHDVRPWGNQDEADSIRVIHRALDAGVNFVDTADVYSGGESERITGKALAGRRDDVVLATKFFMPMDATDPNQRGGSRRWIIREAGGWLSGRWRKDAAGTPTSAARPSARLDMTSQANQRKLEIVEELARLADKAGLTLIELAISFVINHPSVTSAIIGPRT